MLKKNPVLLSEASVNAIQSPKDGLKSANNQPHTVTITKELTQSGRSAHCAYNLQQEEEKQVADEKEHKKKEDEEQRLEKESRRSIFERKRKSQHKVCYR